MSAEELLKDTVTTPGAPSPKDRLLCAIGWIGFEAYSSLAIPEEDKDRHIQEALSLLTEREKEIARLRFGLETGHPQTLDEVGSRFQTTREKIRNIELRYLKKFKGSAFWKICDEKKKAEIL